MNSDETQRQEQQSQEQQLQEQWFQEQQDKVFSLKHT
jgi:hypothetical protein